MPDGERRVPSLIESQTNIVCEMGDKHLPQPLAQSDVQAGRTAMPDKGNHRTQFELLGLV